MVALTWACLVLNLLLIWPSIADIGDLRATVAGEEVDEEFRAHHMVQLAVGGLYMISAILVTIFWMMWVHRSYRNLRRWVLRGSDYSPGWAVGYYFIPILNLFRPLPGDGVNLEGGRPEPQRRARPGAAWRSRAFVAWLVGVHLISAVVNQISLWAGLRADDAGVLVEGRVGRPLDALRLTTVVLLRGDHGW